MGGSFHGQSALNFDEGGTFLLFPRIKNETRKIPLFASMTFKKCLQTIAVVN